MRIDGNRDLHGSSSSQPTADVTIDGDDVTITLVSGTDLDLELLSDSSTGFTSNWSAAQTVTVTGVRRQSFRRRSVYTMILKDNTTSDARYRMWILRMSR